MKTFATNRKMLVGDCVLIEPALRLLSEATGERVGIFVPANLRPLFADHPNLELLEAPEPDSVLLDCQIAHKIATDEGQYFGYGYLPQVGLDARKYAGTPELAFRYHGPEIAPPRAAPIIVIAPFSRSCISHKGGRANKTQTVSWWNRLVAQIILETQMAVISLGNTHDPLIERTANFRGENWDVVMGVLSAASLVVTGDTGILHLAAWNSVAPKLVLNAANPAFFVKAAEMKTTVYQREWPDQWKERDVIREMKRLLREEPRVTMWRGA